MRSSGSSRKRKPKTDTSSFAGFHFLDLYLNCEWKGFVRHALGIEPKLTATPLILGGSVHAGRAAFYQSGGRVKPAEKAVRDYIKNPAVRVEDEGQDLILERRALDMLHAWIVQYGIEDLENYEILSVEELLEAPIPGLPSFVFTGRVDDVRREKRGQKRVLVFDMKTSGYSETLTADSFQSGDQATGYLWLVRSVLKLDAQAVVPDIIFWRRDCRDPSKIRCLRPIEVFRRPRDIEQFQMSVAQKYSEISQKVTAFARGSDPRALFCRNTHYCVAYGHNCEYAGICRSESLLRREVPPAFFKVNQKGSIKTLRETILDRLVEG